MSLKLIAHNPFFLLDFQQFLAGFVLTTVLVNNCQHCNTIANMQIQLEIQTLTSGYRSCNFFPRTETGKSVFWINMYSTCMKIFTFKIPALEKKLMIDLQWSDEFKIDQSLIYSTSSRKGTVNVRQLHVKVQQQETRKCNVAKLRR